MAMCDSTVFGSNRRAACGCVTAGDGLRAGGEVLGASSHSVLPFSCKRGQSCLARCSTQPSLHVRPSPEALRCGYWLRGTCRWHSSRWKPPRVPHNPTVKMQLQYTLQVKIR